MFFSPTPPTFPTNPTNGGVFPTSSYIFLHFPTGSYKVFSCKCLIFSIVFLFVGIVGDVGTKNVRLEKSERLLLVILWVNFLIFSILNQHAEIGAVQLDNFLM